LESGEFLYVFAFYSQNECAFFSNGAFYSFSATGSGKTLAFLLPAMIHINAQVST
jgi:hypothetical protein